MKSRSVLERQDVKRKRPRSLSNIWRTTVLFCSYSFKFSCLLGGLVFISLLFLFLYKYLLTSPYIKLEKVIVTGVDGEIKRHLLKISRLSLGTSLLSINQEELQQKMEKHPWVKSVNLEKRLPHTLIIQAEKEKPLAIVVLGELHYMNRRGKIFKKVVQNEDSDFPLITGLSMTGRWREVQLKLAADVLRVLEAEKEPWSLQGLSEVHVKKNGGVSLYFRFIPASIKLNGDELGRKIDELKRLVRHLNETGNIHMVKGINLDYRDGAVVSFDKS